MHRLLLYTSASPFIRDMTNFYRPLAINLLLFILSYYAHLHHLVLRQQSHLSFPATTRLSRPCDVSVGAYLSLACACICFPQKGLSNSAFPKWRSGHSQIPEQRLWKTRPQRTYFQPRRTVYINMQLFYLHQLCLTWSFFFFKYLVLHLHS